MNKIETKLKSLTLHLKYGEHVTRKKTYVAKCSFRGKNKYSHTNTYCWMYQIAVSFHNYNWYSSLVEFLTNILIQVFETLACLKSQPKLFSSPEHLFSLYVLKGYLKNLPLKPKSEINQSAEGTDFVWEFKIMKLLVFYGYPAHDISHVLITQKNYTKPSGK